MSVTPKVVKKVITNLDSSKVSSLDCIPVMVLKKCDGSSFDSLNHDSVITSQVSICLPVNAIQDGHFRGCSPMRGGRKDTPPLPKICHTYPTMIKLATIIPYLKKIQKIYEWRDTPPEFCWHQHFSLEISKFCYIKKYKYRLYFDT